MPPGLDDFMGSLKEEAKASRVGACHLCGGEGYTLQSDEEGVQRASICACRWDRYMHDLYAAAGVPRPYWDLTLDQWNMHSDAFGEPLGTGAPQKAAIGAFMRKYVKALPALCGGVPLNVKLPTGSSHRVTNVALVGGARSGKTMLGSIVVKESIQNGLHARFYDWLTLLNVARDFDQSAKQDVLVQEFSDSDIVVIDGVCSYGMKIHGYMAMQIDRLARARINNGKPTVLTCEANFREFEAGSGWEGLVDSCLRLSLPTARRRPH